MAQLPFPQINPETLAQAIKTRVAATQNVNALSNGASANYSEVIRGWAEALTSVANPSLAYFENNDQVLFLQTQNQNPQPGVLTYLFNTLGSVSVGQWVYQVSADTVAVSDCTSTAYGPAVGVITQIVSGSTARVQTVGNFLYDNLYLPFLPLIPDSSYYIGAAGAIVAVPAPYSGGYIQEIGFAKSATELVLNIQEHTLV